MSTFRGWNTILQLGVLAAGAYIASAVAQSAATGPAASITPTILNATQVTTPGVPVTAVIAVGSKTGCWIQNDPNSTTQLVVDGVNVANHVTPAPSASFLSPGGVFLCPGNSTIPITVDSFDANHKFYGQVY